jgi:hypothetical protein
MTFELRAAAGESATTVTYERPLGTGGLFGGPGAFSLDSFSFGGSLLPALAILARSWRRRRLTGSAFADTLRGDEANPDALAYFACGRIERRARLHAMVVRPMNMNPMNMNKSRFYFGLATRLGDGWRESVRLLPYCIIICFLCAALPRSAIGMGSNKEKTLQALSNCLSGDVLGSETKLAVSFLLKNMNYIPFDGSVLSESCRRSISVELGTFPEREILALVRYFWDERFLRKFAEITLNNKGRWICGLVCLFHIDRRPLPKLELFDVVLSHGSVLSPKEEAFLLGRSLIIAPSLSLHEITEQFSKIPGDLKHDTLVSFILLAPPTQARSIAELNYRDRSICIGKICAPVRNFPEDWDCSQFVEALKQPIGSTDLLSVKIWALTVGGKKIEMCITRDSALSVRPTPLLEAAFELRLFSPFLSLSDIINNLRSKAFRHFSFTTDDITDIGNIQFNNLATLSDVFAERIVKQIDRVLPPRSGASDAELRTLSEMISNFPAYRQFRLATCNREIRLDDCDVEAWVWKRIVELASN